MMSAPGWWRQQKQTFKIILGCVAWTETVESGIREEGMKERRRERKRKKKLCNSPHLPI